MKELARYESMPLEKLRDGVMDDLVKHYSLERIDLPEFERRSELVSKSSTQAELVALIADLPALPEEAPTGRKSPKSQVAASGQGWSVARGRVRENDSSVAIFGGSVFKGPWQAPRKLTTLCVFGGAEIDLRQAIIPEDGLTISCLCAFGGADIVAPPGMRVVCRGIGIFGGFDRADNVPDDPGAPTVTIEGLAVFGGVSVKVKG